MSTVGGGSPSRAFKQSSSVPQGDQLLSALLPEGWEKGDGRGKPYRHSGWSWSTHLYSLVWGPTGQSWSVIQAHMCQEILVWELRVPGFPVWVLWVLGGWAPLLFSRPCQD